MCYNNKCKIEIRSNINGSTDTITVKGKATKTLSDMRFEYTLNGDECTLIVKNDEAVQTRRGEQNIKMTFRKANEQSVFWKAEVFRARFLYLRTSWGSLIAV